MQAVEAELLLHDIYFGASILPPGRRPSDVPPFRVDNYPVAPQVAAGITSAISGELAAGRIQRVSYVPAHLTPIYGKEEPEKIRIITDFSAPRGLALNDQTDAMHFSMMSHQDAFALLRPGSYMAKLDISKAYRTVGVRPSQWHLLAFCWKDPSTGHTEYYIDTRWPFGHAKAPEVFCRISAAVRAMMAAAGFDATVVYVDDFLVVAGSQDACEAARAFLSQLLAELGFTENIPKRCAPAQTQIFLGLQYCTVATGPHPVTVTVPEDKLRKAEALAARLALQGVASRNELQSAAGYFNHIGQAVWSARAFTRRLIDAIRDATASGAMRIPIRRPVQLDLFWWRDFARTFNGHAVVLERPVMLEGFFSTDASDVGMGGFLSGQHFSVAWLDLAAACHDLPPIGENFMLSHQQLWPRPGHPCLWDIAYRELFAIVWAHFLWGAAYMANRSVTTHCDNVVAEHDVNNLSSPNIFRMALVRALCGFNARHNIRTNVVHITSAANVLADALSRLDLVTFRNAELLWRATVAQTHPAWPGEVSGYRPREFSNPGLMTHRARVAVEAHAP